MKRRHNHKILASAAFLLLSTLTAGNALAQQTPPNPGEEGAAMRQAGAVIVLQNCLMCHNLDHLKYRHLERLGFSATELATLRNGRAPEDTLLRYMDKEAVLAIYGVVPPDLSLMTKAKRGGSEYIYALLTSYYQEADGTIKNHLAATIRMPDVLNASQVGDKSKVEHQARQIGAFLTWAADPHEDERHKLGYGVIAYLILLTGMLYALKRRVWARLQ